MVENLKENLKNNFTNSPKAKIIIGAVSALLITLDSNASNISKYFILLYIKNDFYNCKLFTIFV